MAGSVWANAQTPPKPKIDQLQCLYPKHDFQNGHKLLHIEVLPLDYHDYRRVGSGMNVP